MRPQAGRVVVRAAWLRRLTPAACAAVADLLAGYAWGESCDVRIPGCPAAVWVSVYGEGIEAGAVYTVTVSDREARLVAI